jgi:hypothetical protein
MATSGKSNTKTATKKPAQAQSTASQVPAPRRSTAVSNLTFGGMEGQRAGMEGADRESFAIPFLQILQKMSPQLDRNDPTFIKGAQEGDIVNTANQETYSGEEGIIVLPTSFKRSFTAWIIREKGGGFKGEHAPTDPIIMTTHTDDKNRNILPDGQTQLVDTRLHAVILLNGDDPVPALITMSSTQMKKSKRWMSQMQEIQRKDNLPTFAHSYRLTTIPEKNDKGNWMGWAIEYVDAVSAQEHVDAAIAFYTALQSGQMKMRADNSQAAEQ